MAEVARIAWKHRRKRRDPKTGRRRWRMDAGHNPTFTDPIRGLFPDLKLDRR